MKIYITTPDNRIVCAGILEKEVLSLIPHVADDWNSPRSVLATIKLLLHEECIGCGEDSEIIYPNSLIRNKLTNSASFKCYELQIKTPDNLFTGYTYQPDIDFDGFLYVKLIHTKDCFFKIGAIKKSYGWECTVIPYKNAEPIKGVSYTNIVYSLEKIPLMLVVMEQNIRILMGSAGP